MRIMIDLQSCQSGSRLGGIGRYSLQISKMIAKIAINHEVFIILNNRLTESIYDIRREFSDILAPQNIICFESIQNVREISAPDVNLTKAAEIIREKFIADMNPDAVLITSLIEGLGDDVVTSIRQTQSDYITSAILYDLIPLVESERYLKDDITRKHYLRKIENLNNADFLFAISEFSRDEGCALLRLPPERIINISSAIGDEFRIIPTTDTEKKSLFEKIGIKNKFLLYTASFDSRKNHKNLIAGFALLPKNIRKDYQLVIVGNGMPDIYANLHQYAQEFGLTKEDIIFTGRVSDIDLLSLYNLCTLFVFPPLREGFGLPVLEAMSCGAPVIGSNTTSIPEVVGRHDALFDPRSPTSIAEKIQHALTDAAFMAELRRHAGMQCQRFNWERSARTILETLEHAYALRQERRHGAPPQPTCAAITRILPNWKISDDDLKKISTAIAVNELVIEAWKAASTLKIPLNDAKLGVITTWKTKCGIAAYSEFLLQPYKGSTTIFAPYAPDLLQPDEINVVRCWQIGDESLRNLEHAITIRDINIVLIQFNYGFFSLNSLAFLISVLRDKGIAVFVELHSTIDPPEHILPWKLHTLVPVLRTCARLLVHSEGDLKRLANLGLTNVITLPLGVNRPQTVSVPYQRQAEDFIIASYGFFLPHKGFLELVQTVAGLKIHNKTVKLLMVNAEYPAPISRELIESARQLADSLGLGDRFTLVSDYLPDEESVSYLRQADVIVYPYQATGESASAAVRMGLASGVPVAVTPLDIFSDVADVTYKLPGISIEDIRAGLQNICADIEQNAKIIQDIKKTCSKWLSIHDYKNLTKYLLYVLTTSAVLRNGCPINLIFYAKTSEISTIVGTRTSAGLASEGREGVLAFGPYINLCAGRYALEINGQVMEKKLSAALDFKILAAGQKIIEVEECRDSEDGRSMTMKFSLSYPVHNFEIQIFSRNGIDVEIHTIVISSNISIM